MKTLAERAKYLLELCGNSPSELARIADVTPPSVSQWLSGRTKSLGIEPATRLGKRFGLNPMWISKGRGNKNELSPSSDTTGGSGDAYSISGRPAKEPAGDQVVINQFDAGGSMGAGLLLRDQPGVIQSWSVSQEWIAKNVRSHTGTNNLCIVTGFGDSMRPMYEPGDPLLIDSSVKSVDFDGIYFFRVGNEGFIKRLQRIPGEGIRAISENKAYETWTIKRDMDFEVFGRVLKAWKSEDY
ncbi:helix-turn-helix transcriptional regulator [Azonexus caeni]|uniref:LexA family transcriptional regulator n=1 Tax=Azonexus caeni TaxID=266126 RepID=UPI003A8B91F0